MASMQSTKVTERITATAFELLEGSPAGMRFSELQRKIKESDDAFKLNTIAGTI